MSREKSKVCKRVETVLLTEVLPYETPLFFSNFGFFDFIISSRNRPIFIKSITEKKGLLEAYSYEIKRSELKYRTLGLIHPVAQIEFFKFYQKFENLILYNCNKSKFSLRKPIRKNRFVLNKTDNSNHVIIPNTYFKYGPYNFMYKFFGSYEYNRLEKKFSSLLKFDISKCFPSIYTHSINWALKNKKYAKKYKQAYSFGAEFDKLMSKANYNETNGIIIGPEVSRIFAEIILQEIDIRVEKRLFAHDLKYRIDYQIKRYVDDIYVFSNDSKLLEEILIIYEEELEKFKLHINDSKTELINAPFISNISISKINISRMFNHFFSFFFKKKEGEYIKHEIKNIKRIRAPKEVSMRFINELKASIFSNDGEKTGIKDISRYTIAIIEKKVTQILKYDPDAEINEKQETNLITFLQIISDILFYITALDTVTKNTISIISIFLKIKAFYYKSNIHGYNIIEKRFNDEITLLFNTLNHKDKTNSIEAINLLFALKNLSSDYKLFEDELMKMFNLLAKNQNISYFTFIGIMYYIEDSNEYTNVRNKLISIVLDKFMELENPLSKSDYFCLFFDFMRCKYIHRSKKHELIDIITEKERMPPLNESRKNESINFILNFGWFTEWNTSTKKLLNRKKLAEAY